jgi:uncharacterized protein (TIGR00730 family)
MAGDGGGAVKTVCVYCGSAERVRNGYLQAAFEMGRVLGQAGLALVYGAGSTGLMGAVADGALEAGGEVIGVIPGIFNTPRLAHAGLTRLEVVENIHVRKARMIELADAFIALPGGFGTWEELFEILTWAQIGLHSKPIGLLNTLNYFDRLMAMIDHAYDEGFIYSEHRQLYSHAEEPQALLEVLKKHAPPEGLGRWLTREDLDEASP